MIVMLSYVSNPAIAVKSQEGRSVTKVSLSETKDKSASFYFDLNSWNESYLTALETAYINEEVDLIPIIKNKMEVVGILAMK